MKLSGIITVAFAVFSAPADFVKAQDGKYKFPLHLRQDDYQQGTVWVKLKDDHKDFFKANGSKGSMVRGAVRIKSFLNAPAITSSVRSGHQQHVDISKYYSISFEVSGSLEEYVEELYNTGLFEVVEPVYKIKPLLTPNDPSLGLQGYLDMINAREAWDITQGDEDLVIAIVDTGGDLDHPDLQDKLFINSADPVDGVDNDGDGYVDNFRGWDFSGADLALIGSPGFVGDNDPSINRGSLFAHGTMVGGCAAAATNDGKGVASVGYKTKLLFTKHFADNQADANSNYSSDLYQGILYAATHGAKIINCSWGSPYPSTIAQDIINFVTLDLGCLVIAAAGNSNMETPLYPASYDNVLSVAASNASDQKASFSNFGKTIDILAPGENIYTTVYNNGYISESGTSLAAPIVSGAAALVWAHHPDYTPLQVAEQLRVSSDPSVYTNNQAFLNKLGRGRLDVLAALTSSTPSVRASNQLLVNDDDTTPEPGQHVRLYLDFTNYLSPSSAALKATITSSSPYVTVPKNTFTIGALGTNAAVRNSSSPFEIQLSPSLPIDEVVELLITFSDVSYEDFQLIEIVIPSYINIIENNIITSLTASGRIGFGNPEMQNNGSGFIYGEESLLFEMGLVMGSAATDISNNVRGTGGVFDQDFVTDVNLTKHTPGNRSYSEVSGSMVNSLSSLKVDYQSLVWKNDPYRDFIIIEYKIKNLTSSTISNFHAGLFADWDIVQQGAGDRAGWDSELKLGYVYSAQPGNYARTGIQVLNANSHYYAIDNDQNIAGNPFGVNDGFTDAEKFQTISSGLSRLQAGNPVTGNDVSHVVASGPYTLAAGQTISVAFALHASASMNGLISSARYADSLYNYTLKSPVPEVSDVIVCQNNPAVIQATGAGKFNWYRDFTGGVPVFSGPSLTTESLVKDSVLYVSNADHTYESLRVRIHIDVVPLPTITVQGDREFCDGQSVTLSTDVSDAYLWSNGAMTQTIQASDSGTYSVQVVNDMTACDASEVVEVTVFSKPSANIITVLDNIQVGEPAYFYAEDQADVTWLWNFGDGATSTLKDVIHTYETLGNYTVSLTVTSINNCINSSSINIGPITSTEPFDRNIEIYPNPVNSDKIYLTGPLQHEDVKIELIDIAGRKIIVPFTREDVGFLVDVSSMSNGAYILKLYIGDAWTKEKLIIER